VPYQGALVPGLEQGAEAAGMVEGFTLQYGDYLGCLTC
jgi:hypothetical protein